MTLCQWFRCDKLAEITVSGNYTSTQEPADAIGDLCVGHYAELSETVALYAKASSLRRARPADEAIIIPDPNACSICEHTNAAHMMASFDRRAHCVACVDGSKYHEFTKARAYEDGPIA